MVKRTDPPGQQKLLFENEPGDENIIAINNRCWIRKTDDHYVVLVSEGRMVLAQYDKADHAAKAYAMVILVEQGWAYQKEVAKSFGCNPRTVRRYQRDYERGGVAALAQHRRAKRSTPKQRSRNQKIVQQRKEGRSMRAIARKVGVDEKTVRNVLKRMGWVDPEPEQFILPAVALSAADISVSGEANLTAQKISEAPHSLEEAELSDDGEVFPVAVSLDLDQANRNLDRFFAATGLLDDAAPVFGNAENVIGAGVLIAIPALIKNGVLSAAREVYGSIGPAFYGLRTVMVFMVLMALLRIKRPEALKEYSPQELGRIFGLDRAPEVKTLRNKIKKLAAFGLAKTFGHTLAKKRAEHYGNALGFLYIDGHVRVYHGKRKLPKTHVTQMKRALPATTDYWVNDKGGEPFFVVPTEANRSLTQMLPTILDEARPLIGERRTTVVFDRGGWSPKLFQSLINQGFDILTYRKGKCRDVALRLFQEQKATIDGQQVCYTLADKGVYFLGRKLRLRQVTILRKDGRQTHIITSRRDLTAIETAFRMVKRWLQENFFKYLSEEFALDALVDYGVEAADANREVPNPERKKLNIELRKAYVEVSRLCAQYGMEAFDNPEQRRPTMRGFKIAHSQIGEQIMDAMGKIATLEQKRATTPTRLLVGEVAKGPVIKLSVERKHLTDLIKMVAYQVESELFKTIAPLYNRSEDEGRTLVQEMLSSTADIAVGQNELHIKLSPLSSPHRTGILVSLCNELNQSNSRFPGTNQLMRFSVKPSPPKSMAFPGPRASEKPKNGVRPDNSAGG